MEIKKIEQKVGTLALNIVKQTDLTVLDTILVKESGEWYLRVYIEKTSGRVDIDDCVFLSRELSDELDKIESLLPDGYLLEISSSGEKPIRHLEEYNTLTGRYAQLKLYKSINGKSNFEGKILGTRDNSVVLEVSNCEVAIDFKNISKGRLALFLTEVPEDGN